MDDVFVYQVNLPDNIKEMTVPCMDGYTIFIDRNLSDPAKLKAYHHAMKHIRNTDFEQSDVQEIEQTAHGRTPTPPPDSESRLTFWGGG